MQLLPEPKFIDKFVIRENLDVQFRKEGEDPVSTLDTLASSKMLFSVF